MGAIQWLLLLLALELVLRHTYHCIITAGQARLLRLLHKLKVTQVDRHAAVLLAVTNASPAMAADYLSSCQLNLEPKSSSSKWLVAMTLVGQLIQAAAQGDPPFQDAVERYAHRRTPVACNLLYSCKIRNLQLIGVIMFHDPKSFRVLVTMPLLAAWFIQAATFSRSVLLRYWLLG